MLLTTVENLATILPALATLTEGTTRTGRAGKKLRLYRPEPTLNTVTDAKMVAAVTTLLLAGYVVKVYEASRVYTPALEQGAVVWNFRATHRVRTAMVVEVALGK